MTRSDLGQTLSRVFQDSLDLRTCHAGEPLKELLDRRSAFQIFEQRLDRNTRTSESPGPTHLVGSALHRVATAPVEHIHTVSQRSGTDKVTVSPQQPRLRKSIPANTTECTTTKHRVNAADTRSVCITPAMAAPVIASPSQHPATADEGLAAYRVDSERYNRS